MERPGCEVDWRSTVQQLDFHPCSSDEKLKGTATIVSTILTVDVTGAPGDIVQFKVSYEGA